MTLPQKDRNKVNLIHLPTGINIHELFKDSPNFPKKRWIVEQKLLAWFSPENQRESYDLYNNRHEVYKVLLALGYKNSIMYSTNIYTLFKTNHCIEEFGYIYIKK